MTDQNAEMEWSHSETIGLANARCCKCHGTGLTPGTDRLGNTPCNCVLRRIFRSVLNRYIFCASAEPFRSRVILNRVHGRDASSSWARMNEDFCADFYLIAKRTLDSTEMAVFRFHFIGGADWRFCCRHLALDRGAFFHMVYRIEQKLGRIYREVRPYALYPCDEYFGGTMRKAAIAPTCVVTKMRPQLAAYQRFRVPVVSCAA